MCANDICKPLPLVAGKVIVRVFLDRLAVRIAKKNNSTSRSEETTLFLCVKSKNKGIEGET